MTASSKNLSSLSIKIGRKLPHIFAFILIIAAAIVSWKVFKTLSVHEIILSFKAIPHHALLGGMFVTCLSYFVLSFYDVLACHCVGVPILWRRAFFASFCSYVLSHNLGFSAISGAAVRFRLYRGWGISNDKIASIIAFCSVMFILGTIGLIGLFLCWNPQTLLFLNYLPFWALYLIGIGCFCILGSYVYLSAHNKEIRWKKWHIDLPDWKTGLAQIIVSMLEISVTSWILWCVLAPFPLGCSLTFGGFLAIYLLAYTAGLVASVPGGLGVFDSTILISLSHWFSTSHIMGAIFVFRLFYYIIPLFIAGLIFASHECYVRIVPLLQKNGRVLHPSFVIRDSEAYFSVSVAAGLLVLTGIFIIAYAIFVPIPETTWLNYSFLLQTTDALLMLSGILLISFTIGILRRLACAWRASITILTSVIILFLIMEAQWWAFLPPALLLLVLTPFYYCYYRKIQWNGIFSSWFLIFLYISFLGSISLFLWSLSWKIIEYHLIDIWWYSLLYNKTLWLERLLFVVMNIFIMITGLSVLKVSKVVSHPWSFLNSKKDFYLPKKIEKEILSLLPLNIEPDGVIMDETAHCAISFIKYKNIIIALGVPLGEKHYYIPSLWRLRDYVYEQDCHLAIIQQGQSYGMIYEDMGLKHSEMIHKNFIFFQSQYKKEILDYFSR